MGSFSRQFYAKLAGGCFVIGACMELFMIKTGFYGVVAENEAGRFLEGYDERRQRADALRTALLERHARGEVRLPDSLLREFQEAKGVGAGAGVEKQQHQQQQGAR